MKQIKSAFEILPQIKNMDKTKNPIIKGYDTTDKEIQEAWKNDRPITLSLYLGAKCNLKCLYCFTRSGVETKNNLTEREYKKTIDQALGLGVKNVMFTGRGEPLLCPLLFKLLEYIKKEEGWSIVLTNGIFVTPEIAKKLFELNCSVMTKINSFDPKIQDRLVGVKGVAEKMYRGLNYLIEAGFNKTNPTRLANDNLICKLTYKEAPLMAKYFISYNIQPIFETILWEGRAIDNIDTLKISKKELDWLEKELKKLKGSCAKGTYFKGEECIVDTMTILINEKGDMMPCWAREDLSNGNVRKSALKDLWYNSRLVEMRKNHKEIIKKVKKGLMPPRVCPGRQYALDNLNKKDFDVSKL